LELKECRQKLLQAETTYTERQAKLEEKVMLLKKTRTKVSIQNIEQFRIYGISLDMMFLME